MCSMQANIWQLGFHAAPSSLKSVNLDLSTDDNILRYQVTKSRDLAKVRQWRVVEYFGKQAALQLATGQGGGASGAEPNSGPNGAESTLT
jgi:hypothetical protein